ncbi:MAG: sulfurtransferase-like selenium metabolism protein YedF [Solirubrobacterales bacterium]
MEHVVDCRGLTCPQPVVLTKQALERMASGELVTVVDNKTAVENVVRMAENMAYDVDVEEKGEEYRIHIVKTVNAHSPDLDPYGRSVLLVTSRFLGRGDDELGATLMKSYFYSLSQMTASVGTIILMNAGVALSCQGSEVLDHLLVIEQAGVDVLSCGTCLDYYNLKSELMVGKVTNMYAIMEKISIAPKVITL